MVGTLSLYHPQQSQRRSWSISDFFFVPNGLFPHHPHTITHSPTINYTLTLHKTNNSTNLYGRRIFSRSGGGPLPYLPTTPTHKNKMILRHRTTDNININIHGGEYGGEHGGSLTSLRRTGTSLLPRVAATSHQPPQPS